MMIFAPAALAGCGLAYLPTWLTSEHLKRGELQIVLSGSPVESASMHPLWPVTRNLAPKVRVVVDALVERFASSAPGQVP